MPQYDANAEATKRLTGQIGAGLEQLNTNIRAASLSSEHLSRSLNRLTLFGGIVGAAGVAVSIIALWHGWDARPVPLIVRANPQVTVVNPTPRPSSPSGAAVPSRPSLQRSRPVAPTKQRP